MREGVESSFAVIGTNAAFTDAAKGKVFLCHMPDRVIDGHAARYGFLQHAITYRVIIAVPIKRKWPVALIDESDRIVGCRRRDHRQNWPEDFLRPVAD